MTQHQKILNFSNDGEFHCQNEYRANYIFSPHKRRQEIIDGSGRDLDEGKIERGRYQFETRPCTHGQNKQFDYRLLDKQREPIQVKLFV